MLTGKDYAMISWDVDLMVLLNQFASSVASYKTHLG
jgi:hypothetical protein